MEGVGIGSSTLQGDKLKHFTEMVRTFLEANVELILQEEARAAAERVMNRVLALGATLTLEVGFSRETADVGATVNVTITHVDGKESNGIQEERVTEGDERSDAEQRQGDDRVEAPDLAGE